MYVVLYFLPRINVYLLSVDKELRRWRIRIDAPEGDGNGSQKST